MFSKADTATRRIQLEGRGVGRPVCTIASAGAGGELAAPRLTGLLLALLFVSVFVGVAMLASGMLLRLWKQRGKPLARDSRANRIDPHALDGTFQVVGKAQLPLAR